MDQTAPKIAPIRAGISTPSNACFLGLTWVSPQTASRSVQTFLRCTSVWPTQDHATCDICCTGLSLRCGLITRTRMLLTSAGWKSCRPSAVGLTHAVRSTEEPVAVHARVADSLLVSEPTSVAHAVRDFAGMTAASSCRRQQTSHCSTCTNVVMVPTRLCVLVGILWLLNGSSWYIMSSYVCPYIVIAQKMKMLLW